jgi:hypothetical protein
LIPTFVDSPVFPFDVETRELSVISTLSPIGSSCDPVQLKFNICNDRSTEGVSAAFIDEVQFDFTNRGGTVASEPSTSRSSRLRGSRGVRPIRRSNALAGAACSTGCAVPGKAVPHSIGRAPEGVLKPSVLIPWINCPN